MAEAIAESARMADAASAHLPPLVSHTHPFSNLSQEYANGARAELYEAKAHFFEERYQAIRRVRGDGNCFYRAFHVSWMERLLQLPAADQEDAWKRIVPTATAAVAKHLPEEQRFQMQELSVSFAERTSALCAASTAGEPEVPLLAAATDAEAAGASLMWLRLLTSAYMRANAETFEPVCATEARSFGDYLAKEVETRSTGKLEANMHLSTPKLSMACLTNGARSSTIRVTPGGEGRVW